MAVERSTAGLSLVTRQVAYSFAALVAGGAILLVAGLAELSDRLPAAIGANALVAMVVRSYAWVKPLVTGFSGPRYLGLLGVGVGVYWLLPSDRLRRLFLLGYSAALAVAMVHIPVWFLGWIGVLIAYVYVLARVATDRPWAAWGGIIGIVFVYMSVLALPLLRRAVPFLAIGEELATEHMILQGYFMFLPLKSIHYLCDVARGRSPAVSAETLVLWILFFPSFRNAPFDRIQSFSEQLHRPTVMPDGKTIGRAIGRIAIGAVKGAIDILIKMYLSPMSVWADPQLASTGQLWLAAYGYTIGMYLEFSGYADAMIGSSALLGYRLSENFDQPYLRYDIRTFWHGWSITTSHWLRDYVYFPLGGSRTGNVYLNLMTTMLVAGAWHALSPNFVAWGALHGFGLIVSHWLMRRRRTRGRPEPSWRGSAWHSRLTWVLGVVVTFHFVTVAWVFHHNGYYGIGVLVSLRMVACMFGLCTIVPS